MPQLHLYLSANKAEEVKRRARNAGISVSKYLGQLVSQSLDEPWPDDYFATVIGGWKGEPLERPGQPGYEMRDELDVSS